MATTSLALVLFLSAAGPASASPSARAAAATGVSTPAWEKIFEMKGPSEWLTSVLATGPNDWIASGRGGIVRATKDGIERTSTGPRVILGLFDEAPDSVFAFGDDELVMHFDGKTWVEKHIGPKPKRPGRGADLVYSGFYADSQLAAFGVTLLLVRRPDHTWEVPPETERKKLLDIGQLGPPIALPAKCDKAGWFWLGKNRGFFRCHDRRAFIFDAGKLTPKGKIPTACESGFDEVTFGQGELYASCGAGKIWKTDGERWRVFATFKGDRVGSISVTESCVFAAGNRVVWRSCRPARKERP